MKKALFILLTFCAVTLQAQDLGDTLHVAHYDLNLDIRDFSTHIIYGQADLTIVSKMNNLATVTLDMLGITADSVFINGLPATFQHQGSKLAIASPTLQSGDTALVRVHYHGVPYLPGMVWGGIHYSGQYCYNIGVDFDYIPHVFGRIWFPCLDVFTDKSTYTMHVRTEAGKMAVCGGMLTDSLTLGDNSRLWTWDMTDPIPTYLASVAVGDYRLYADTFHGMERVIPIQIYAQPNTIDRVAGSFVHLKDILRLYEQLFGPYRWQRVGYVAVNFNNGAMEHATNIAYPNAAITGGTEYESLYAHELFHHWFGDLITCQRAEEMWINEGFASYSEALVAGLLHNNYLGSLRDKHRDVLQNIANNDGGYYALDEVPQSATYGTHSYDKGALVVHSLRSYMGDSLFFNSFRNLLQDYAFRNISSPEMFAYLSQLTGTDMTGFYEGWVHQPGFLHFSIDSIIPLSEGHYRVYLHQKLHHATHFANDNRVDLTFVSCSRQLYTVPNTVFSGGFGYVDVDIPFTPVFGIVDYAEKLMDATFDYTRNMTGGSTWSLTAASCNFRLDNFPDTVLVRIEHNLVTPDVPTTLPQGIIKMSDNHYWNIGMAYNPNINTIPEGFIQFRFLRGLEEQLDFELFGDDYDIANLKLLYRETPRMPWRIIPYTRSGSPYAGWVKTTSLNPGQYCFAIGEPTAGVESYGDQGGLRLYPNPAKGSLQIELPSSAQETNATITDSTGRIIERLHLSPGANVLNIQHLPVGLYMLATPMNGKQHVVKFVKE